ncbi:MAG: hypothetical protein Q9185_002128 [Variospora sp. 1 TL-2023]
MASALFISVEGKCKFPVGQILPISFAQSLFFVAMIIMPVPSPSRMVQIPSSWVQCLPLVAYYISVFSTPFSVGKMVFLPLLITIRVLLLCPFVFRLPALRGSGSTAIPAQNIHSGYSASYKLALFCSIIVFVHRTYLAWDGVGLSQTLAGINSDPAVSALGYDFILHVVISSTWAMLNPGLVHVSP